ncbi:UV radiation resistance-associated gene protein-like isoform X1 [Clavelina lepadiformis]|uniref:UV radiation resistance-associated gene protein-like isoform X1 n=2 Tax=Clavelina lepadiformis TaxID=159417 RepID=UPI00404185F5
MKQENEDTELQIQPVVLQQRRIRHISSICARNLTIAPSSPNESHDTPHEGPLLYFTLHTSDTTSGGKEEIFKSEKVNYSANPTWPSFSARSVKFSHLTSFTVRLWIGNEGTYMPALQWEIFLHQLHCIGQTLHSDMITFHSNAVALTLHGLYYAPPTSVTTSPKLTILPPCDEKDAKSSYHVFALRRILSCRVATSQCRRNVVSVRKLIKNLIIRRRETSQLEVEVEDLQARVTHLRDLLQQEKLQLSNERELARKAKWNLQQQEADLTSRQENLKQDRSSHSESYNSYLLVKEHAAQIASQLGLRRRDILSELSHIFPISSTMDTNIKSQKRAQSCEVHTICAVKLPDSENFSSKEDLQTSVALGYTCQLLSMMSQFLLLPLRYPIILKGSMSSIVDHATDKLSDKERLFPVHVRGSKDRFLFEYGVFLLNKDVAQLRYFCGLGTHDLRPTLHNIRTLLEERLGAKSTLGYHSQPIAINDLRHSRAPAKEINSPYASECLEEFVPPPSYAPEVQIEKSPRNETESEIAAPINKLTQVESRNNELSQLRHQLFGSNSEKKAKERRIVGMNDQPMRNEKATDSRDITHMPNMQEDSAESVRTTPSHHRRLTGLEEIGESKKKEMKKNLASARAELLGRSSAPRYHDNHRWRTTEEGGSQGSEGCEEYVVITSEDEHQHPTSSYLDQAPPDEVEVNGMTGWASNQQDKKKVFIIDPNQSGVTDDDEEIDLC